MSQVIKVVPVLIVLPTTLQPTVLLVLLIDPEIISIINTPPAVEVEATVVATSTSPMEVILKLIDGQIEVRNYTEFLTVIREVILRFDTDPKRYSKDDFLTLVLAITKCFKYLYNLDISQWSSTAWSTNPTDDKVPTEKLVKETIDRIDSILTWISNDPDKDELINFINVASDFTYYTLAKTLYPHATIFYLDDTLWIIYANGLEYNFANLPDFLDVKYRITLLELSIGDVLLKSNINLINKNNGAYFDFPTGGLFSVKLDLATQDSNGALSSTDKVKIDSLGWVSF